MATISRRHPRKRPSRRRSPNVRQRTLCQVSQTGTSMRARRPTADHERNRVKRHPDRRGCPSEASMGHREHGPRTPQTRQPARWRRIPSVPAQPAKAENSRPGAIHARVPSARAIVRSGAGFEPRTVPRHTAEPVAGFFARCANAWDRRQVADSKTERT